MTTVLRRRDIDKRDITDTTKEASKNTQPSPPMKQTDSLDSFFSQPVNSSNLAIFRIVFGLLMAFLQYRALFLQDIIEPNFDYAELNFHFCFATEIPKLPIEYILTLYGFSSIAAFCMGIGLLYRASCVVFLVIYTYLNLLEKSRYNNHFYLYILLTLFFLITDAHKRISIDSSLSRLFSTKESQHDTRVPFWQFAIFRFQLFVVYFYSGIAKLNYDWLFRFEPMSIWSNYSRFSTFRKVVSVILPGDVVQSYLGCFFSVGGLFFDLFIGFFLLFPSSRPLGFLMTTFFHLSNHCLFNIGTFPWVMMAANVLFIEENTLSNFIANIREKISALFSSILSQNKPESRPILSKNKPENGSVLSQNTTENRSILSQNKPENRSIFSRHLSLPKTDNEKLSTVSSRRGMSKLLKGFLVMYVVIQLLVPFRHWLYPGNVNWTLEGHQFSWRMMLNEEDVIMRINIVGQSRNYTFDPYQLSLTTRQIKRMLTDPEMVVQLVNHIKTNYIEEREVAIKVDMWKGLNGRPYQRYIDNTVDLSAVNPKTFSFDWIIPQMSDDVIDFHKIREIKRQWHQKRNDVKFFMETAGQGYRVFMHPNYCDNVRLVSMNSQISFIVGSIETILAPGEGVTVPSNATHIIVPNSHTTSIWYYVFDCHVSLFHESLRYISPKGWKYTHIW